MCPACGYYAGEPRFKTVCYCKCSGCGTIWSVGRIDAFVETQNDKPETRNTIELNSARVQRVRDVRPDLNLVIDFGCGNRELIACLDSQDVQAVGTDLDTETQPETLISGVYDAAFMIESIEHLEHPSRVLREICRALKPGGVVYIETSLSDGMGDDWASNGYVDPAIGHTTILSLAGLRLLADQEGFASVTEINPSTFILRKT